MTIFQNIAYGLKILKINDKTKYIGEDSDPKWVSRYNAKKTEIEKDFLKNQKIAEKKLVELEKNRKILEEKIATTKLKYQKDPLLNQLGPLTEAQIVNEINILYDEYETLAPRTSLFKKPVENAQAKEVHFKIEQLEKTLKLKKPIDKEIQNLIEDLDDVDYNITYWQNFAQDKKEQAEKSFTSRNLTKQEIYQRVMDAIALVGLR